MTAISALYTRKATEGINRRCAVVTPSDTKDLTDATGDALPSYAQRLYIGVAGDVKVMGAGDTTGIVFKAHPVGYMNMAVRQVFSTGTAATNIVALFD